MKKGTKLLVGAALGAAAGAAAYKALKKEEKPATPVTYDSIRPGQVWLDTNGKPIQAHGFSVFYDPKEATYYWYRENKEDTKKGGTVWTKGIRYYASADLYNWEDRGYLIPPSDDLNDPLHPIYCIDRPHILYCEATKKYVCWIKVMAGEISQFMTILTADRFEGPYEYARKIYNPLGMNAGDFCLHVDSETKKAYIWFERPHFQLICATLTEDYTAASEEYSVHYDGLFPPLTREAPTFFERGGRKYLFTSGTTGYFPNKSDVCVFTDYHGEYRSLGDPCVGDRSGTTFSSQITSVLQLPGGKYVACADRWMPQWYVKPMAKQILAGMERHFKDYQPDTSPVNVTAVSGQLQKHNENTYLSRYVWLPMEWQTLEDGTEKPVIRWQDEWRVEDLS